MLELFLAVIVSALSAWGFWIFNQGIARGDEKPNTAAWNLWVLLTIINLGSYFTMNRDWYISALLITDTSLCIMTWLMTWSRGHFEPPPQRDYIPIALTLIAIIIWKISSAANANLFAQLPMAISFAPYWLDAWSGKIQARAWIIWTSGFALDIPLIYLRHIQTCRNDYHDYLYQGIGVILHGGIAAIALYRKR